MVLVRCEGSPELGLGHTVRCLALASALRDAHGSEVAFAMNGDSIGAALVRDAGFLVQSAPDGVQAGEPGHVAWLRTLLDALDAGILVLDVRDELSLDDVLTVRRGRRLCVAVLDDGSERRLAADHVFLPPVPQAEALVWPGFTGVAHVGWEWVVLRSQFAEAPVRRPREQARLLVAMGGTDPARLTPFVLEALADLGSTVECLVVIGPGGPTDDELAPAVARLRDRAEIVRGGDMRACMLASDVGVLSFGVTAYEAAASGLPAVHVCLSADHASSSSAFAHAGMAISLGEAAELNPARLASCVGGLLAEPARLREMGARARDLVDGGGAARIAAVLAADEGRVVA